MATREEKLNSRDLTFSGWIRKNLPDSNTGFMVTDIDFVLFNYKTKKIMIVEIKCRMAEVKTWQKKFYRLLLKWLTKGMDKEWTFSGIHLIQFEKTFFTDGKCYLDRKEISEKDLVLFLSMTK